MVYFFIEYMENQMNVGNQNAQQIGQNPVNQPTIKPEKPKTNYLMIGVIVLACFVTFGFGGFYLGGQSSKLQLTTNEKQNQISPSPSLSVSNPEVNENKITQPVANCTSTYSSKYLKLNFKYDSCAWKLNEGLITPEGGIYSIITATHNSSHRVVVKAKTMGVGGHNPDCYQVGDVSLLGNDIVRIHLISSPLGGDSPKYYHYLNSKNDYAIKGYPGEFGDEKFKEYFTFLNPKAFPNTNMCWRGGGINPVAVLQPKEGYTESYQINKDITISIEEENVMDKEFLMSADALAVSIYSGLTQ